jgi:UDP-sugar diphosphatase
MKNIIEDFKIEELKNPKFINTKLVKFKQNGILKSWEIVEAYDSVAILIYHREREAFILVKQFRPAVYMKNRDGLTVELCAGIVDKDLSLKEIAKEEVLEECGYEVSTSDIEKITSVNSAVGFAGSKQTIFYVEVDESMHVASGGGIENELIEVIELPVDEVKGFIYDETITKTTGLLFALMWWLDRNRLHLD